MTGLTDNRARIGDNRSMRSIVSVHALALVAAALAGCTRPGLSEPACGAGTHAASDGSCVVDLVCGPGTTQVGDVCLGTGTGGNGGTVTCGPGTHVDGNECVPDGGAPPGDLGMPADGGAGTAIRCGLGTHLVNGVCYADDGCGPGTHADGNGACVPDAPGSGPQYQVRVAVTQVGADGYSSIPLFVIGTNGDGTPATDTVILTTSIPGEGTIAPATMKVSSVGSTTYLTPCNAAQTPACLGTFVVNLALASAPTTVIAHSAPITLVAPAGVGSDSPCLAGGNVIFYHGDSGDYIHPGIDTITQGQWSIQSSGTAPMAVTVHVTPTQSTQGLWWDLEFASTQLNQPLDAQVYTDAQRAPFAQPGHPGIDIGGDGRGCNTISGSFQVEDLTMSGATIKSFTATFEQHCEGGTAALRGCVHFEQ